MNIQSVFNIICILLSCGLYTMAMNVFTWRITTNRVHLFSSLVTSQFSLIASVCVFLQKIHGSARNFLNFLYIYKKLKLGTAKHICMKWVFLPQWGLWNGIELRELGHLPYCNTSAILPKLGLPEVLFTWID